MDEKTASNEVKFFDAYYEKEAYNPVGWTLRLEREVRSLRKAVGAGSLGKVLSLGCGDGQFECMLAPFATRVVGLDISPQGIEIARRRAATTRAANAEFRCMSFSDLRWDEHFDLIVCLAFLHHVPEQELPALLQRCFRHLKPGGFFYSQDPNRKGVLRKICRRLHGEMYAKFHSADERELEPETLRDDLLQAGFHPVELRHIDLTLIPSLYLLAGKPGWPLHLCALVDRLWCSSPLAPWSSGFAAVARKQGVPK